MHHDDRRPIRARRRRSWAAIASASLAMVVPLISPNAAGAAGTAITSSTPPDAMVGVAYSHTFTADAEGALWSVTSGALPDGLTLGPSTGQLTGTPLASGTVGPTTVAATWAVPDMPAITAGYFHTCALLNNGSVDCWGRDNYGQSADQSGPFTVVDSSAYHNCGLTQSGAADCWGMNTSNQATDMPGPYTTVGAGLVHSCGLTPSGAADCWGDVSGGQETDQPGPYTALAVAPRHNCALTPTGSADCWGINWSGTTTDMPGPFVSLTNSYYHNCGLTPSGAADCWGGNSSGQATDQPGPYTALVAGIDHTCGLTPSGAVDCWGSNSSGQATDQPGPYTTIDAGSYHTCAVTTSGAVDCWGDNGNGQATDRAVSTADVTVEQTFSIVVAPAIGTISGTVTEEGTGTPLAQVAVRLLDGTTGVTTVVTDANGDYEFTAVPVGANYRVRFTDQTARHLTEYNGDSTKYSTTPPLSVTVLATTTVDAALAVNTAAAAITGQVTAAGSGTPLAGVTIQVYRNDVLVKTANTDAAGEFLVGGLDPTGTWKVRYRDATGIYRGAYWNGQASLATATGITLTAGAVTDADAALVAR